MSSYEDEITWLDAASFGSRYRLNNEQQDLEQAGGGQDAFLDDDPQEGSSSGPAAAAAEPLSILNRSGQVDTMGSPFSNDEYESIPLTQEYADLMDIKIKKVSFVRQEKWKLEDQLHRVIFLPKKGHPVLLLTAMIGAVFQVIQWTLKKFKDYYIPRETEETTETQAYLKAGHQLQLVGSTYCFLNRTVSDYGIPHGTRDFTGLLLSQGDISRNAIRDCMRSSAALAGQQQGTHKIQLRKVRKIMHLTLLAGVKGQQVLSTAMASIMFGPRQGEKRRGCRTYATGRKRETQEPENGKVCSP